MKTSPYRQPLAQPARPYAFPQHWDAIVARQQEIYEELLASHELPTGRPGPRAARRPASARELTRDLAGWTPQMGAALCVAPPQPRH
ncbi:hypothetical protein [Hymenobacter daeguensis]